MGGDHLMPEADMQPATKTTRNQTHLLAQIASLHYDKCRLKRQIEAYRVDILGEMLNLTIVVYLHPKDHYSALAMDDHKYEQ